MFLYHLSVQCRAYTLITFLQVKYKKREKKNSSKQFTITCLPFSQKSKDSDFKVEGKARSDNPCLHFLSN